MLDPEGKNFDVSKPESMVFSIYMNKDYLIIDFTVDSKGILQIYSTGG